MKKRIEYKIENNDLDKVSGGASWDGAFRPSSNQYHIHPYYCQHCGFLMGEEEDINDGDECLSCNGIQKIKCKPDYNPNEDGPYRVI